jgi:hypothetical protein
VKAAVAPPVQRKLAADAGGPVTSAADPGAAPGTAEVAAQYGRALASSAMTLTKTDVGPPAGSATGLIIQTDRPR